MTKNMKNGHGFRWKSGRTTHGKDGYFKAWNPTHPRSHDGYVLEHILIAEKALGKLLPEKAEVHHANLNTSDNENSNLVVCQDRKYHRLLHIRTKALLECGNADHLKCNRCWEYSHPREMTMISGQNIAFHPECYREYLRRWKLGMRGRLEKRAVA